jgi:acyl transferase domain-containing protein/acyl carrier protein
LEALQAYAVTQGFLVQPLEIRGKVHNPENMDLAHELSALCAESELLRLPPSDKLQCPVRSNRDGNVIPPGQRSLSDDVLYTILASRSEWYKVLQGVAENLKKTSNESHGIISLGIGDFIPLMPFNKLGLRMKKTEWSGPEATEQAPSVPHPRTLDHSYPDDAIAIVGASCRLPGANNLDELWDIISTGQDTHQELGNDRIDISNSHRAFLSGNFAKNRKWYGNLVDGVDRFDRAFFGTNAREMTNMDPQQRMLLELAFEAMDCSGYTKSHVRSRGDNVGCFIGASYTEYLENTCGHAPTAYTAPGTIRAFLCGRISYHFGWTGPSEVIDTACSASLVAVTRAVKAIRQGECPVALAGGINIITGVHNYMDLARAGFLSPTGQCKPWDKDADGYCRSDGAGLVVLKSLKQALADGDRIMAVIAGAATNQGGLSSTITNPDPVQQARLYREVLRQGEIAPEQVTYVEAHGTGTQAGDKIETSSLRAVFGNPKRADELHIGSIKGNIGRESSFHTSLGLFCILLTTDPLDCETAAGVAGLLKIITMLDHQMITPQANHRVWNPSIPSLTPDRMAISIGLAPWDAPFRVAMVNSFGAAGSNATVLCCEAPPQQRQIEDSSEPTEKVNVKQPVILTAHTETSLRSYREVLAKYLTKSISSGQPPLPIDDIAYTLSEKRRRHKFSLVLEAGNTQELAKLLLSDDCDRAVTTAPLDATSKKPIILVFGGQSKQILGLNRTLYTSFPTFRKHLDFCNTYLQNLGYPPILPAVFQTDRNLDDIVVLQTGHVAIQYAAAQTWLETGLQVDAVVGHSLGELSALAVSGKLSIEDCLRLVAERAKLMQTRWGADQGAMLAVFATRGVVEEMLAQLDGTLEIACYNSETSQVVSGDRASAAAFETYLRTQRPEVKFVRVDTSHGFHSHLCEPILAELDEVTASLEWKTPTIPLELCVAGETNPGPDAPYSPSRHAREPVFFANAIQRLEERLGRSCVWLEAGLDTPIMGMTKRAVAQPQTQHSFIGVTTKEAGGPAGLISRTVGKLWKKAVPVTHWAFLRGDGQASPNAVWLPPYAFDRTAAWLDNTDHATDLRVQLDEAKARGGDATPAGADVAHKPLRLVSPLPESAGDKPDTRRFRVAAESERFRTIVAGHAVRGRPLCPASVYLECVTMALQLVLGDAELRQSSLEFEGLDIQAPLGLTEHQQVEIVLRLGLPSTSRFACEFALVSRQPSQGEKTTVHAKGLVKLRSVENASDSRLHVMARLVERNIAGVEAAGDAERMLSGRVYKLFSRVVDYGRVLQGIATMTMRGTEAVATIDMPKAHSRPGASESTVLGICDAVAMDSFIQVVGLAMNTSDSTGAGEVMICNGIDSSVVASGFNFEECSSYRVWASYTQNSRGNQAMGDVFAWNNDGEVVAAFTGCRFVKLDITRLERLLGPGKQHGGAQTHAAHAHVVAAPPAQERVVERLALEAMLPRSSVPTTADSSYGGSSTDDTAATAKTTPGTMTPPMESVVDVRQLLETYTGAAAATIADDIVIADLGLDSLASTEMAFELQAADGRPISGGELTAMTVKQLEERLYGGVREKPLAVAADVPQRNVATAPINRHSEIVPAAMHALTLAAHHSQASSPSPSGALVGKKMTELLVETTGINPSAIDPQATLQEIGVDSLALTEILSVLAEICVAQLKTDDITLDSKIAHLVRAIGADLTVF